MKNRKQIALVTFLFTQIVLVQPCQAILFGKLVSEQEVPSSKRLMILGKDGPNRFSVVGTCQTTRISKYLYITAGHCVGDFDGSLIDPSRLWVGDQVLDENVQIPQHDQIVEVIPHPDFAIVWQRLGNYGLAGMYAPADSVRGFDLALLRTKAPDDQFANLAPMAAKDCSVYQIVGYGVNEPCFDDGSGIAHDCWTPNRRSGYIELAKNTASLVSAEFLKQDFYSDQSGAGFALPMRGDSGAALHDVHKNEIYAVLSSVGSRHWQLSGLYRAEFTRVDQASPNFDWILQHIEQQDAVAARFLKNDFLYRVGLPFQKSANSTGFWTK
jgi:hypothetical protein